ncbi:MAG: methyltransferase [Alphaproteobacteria bacterium]|nr:methyltransferase [Alphaproteobacteria bacterium]
MAQSSDLGITLPAVSGVLNYLADADQKPVFYPSVAGAGETRFGGEYAAHAVPIHDGRPVADRFSLDAQGFQLAGHPTEVVDFLDQEQIETIYEREIEKLVKDHTGAAHVVVFDHTLRADSAELRERKKMRDPARSVHNDYTDRSAPRRVRDLLPEAEAEVRLQSRFAIVNVWRPIAGPVRSSPLALCDARSVADTDLVPSERRAWDRIGEVYQVLFNPQHRWYYFPDMARDEALLIKTYDSERSGPARSAVHTAFEDPTTPADAAPRESIESRTLVFF